MWRTRRRIVDDTARFSSPQIRVYLTTLAVSSCFTRPSTRRRRMVRPLWSFFRAVVFCPESRLIKELSHCREQMMSVPHKVGDLQYSCTDLVAGPTDMTGKNWVGPVTFNYMSKCPALLTIKSNIIYGWSSWIFVGLAVCHKLPVQMSVQNS